MIQDQEALASWMARRAIKRRAAEATARWEARRIANIPAANLDWIDSHRPAIIEPRIIFAGSAGR